MEKMYSALCVCTLEVVPLVPENLQSVNYKAPGLGSKADPTIPRRLAPLHCSFIHSFSVGGVSPTMPNPQPHACPVWGGSQWDPRVHLQATSSTGHTWWGLALPALPGHLMEGSFTFTWNQRTGVLH